jgi:hypothetical protein
LALLVLATSHLLLTSSTQLVYRLPHLASKLR